MARGKWTDAEIEELVKRPDRFYVKGKDPNRYYRHIRKDDQRVEEMQDRHFRIETTQDGAAPDSTLAIESDGTSKVRNVPGMLLVSQPKELHDKITAKKRDRFEEMAKREEEESMEQVKHFLKKAGMPSKLKRILKDTGRSENITKNF
jgi:hypothetical protein